MIKFNHIVQQSQILLILMVNEDIDPVEHYLKIGFALGYNPGPDFSTKDYYNANNDVEEYGMNPLLHYEMYGRREQRKLSFND